MEMKTLTINGQKFQVANVSQTPLYAQSIEECTQTDKVYVLPDGYIYAYTVTQGNQPEIIIEPTVGGYWYADTWNPNGVFKAHEECCAKRTNIIPVTPGDQISYRGKGGSSPDSVVWLDSVKSYIGDERYDSVGSAVTVTVPTGAAYVWFGSFDYVNNVDQVVLDVRWINCQTATEEYQWVNTGIAFVQSGAIGITDQLRNKKIIYDGDSICMGFSAGGGYASQIADITGSTYDNQAVGGARLCAHDTQHSVVKNINNLPNDGDLYCFQGGINDYWGNTPLGVCTAGDYTGELDTATICGALEQIFRYALSNFVGKPICFVITHKIQSTSYQKNSAGHSFQDYRDAMVKVCEKYSVPYYDAFSESGVNGWNTVQNNAFLTGNGAGTPDGIHPSTEGYKRYYVPQLLDLFRRIMPLE